MFLLQTPQPGRLLGTVHTPFRLFRHREKVGRMSALDNRRLLECIELTPAEGANGLQKVVSESIFCLGGDGHEGSLDEPREKPHGVSNILFVALQCVSSANYFR